MISPREILFAKPNAPGRRYYRKYPVISIFHTPTPTDALEIAMLSGRGDRMRPIY